MRHPWRITMIGLLLLAAGCPRPVIAPGLAPTSPPASRQEARTPTPVALRSVVLATTTSTQDSGLLDLLMPIFERQSGYQVKTISVGTGAALALGARGEADVLLVHAPDAE